MPELPEVETTRSGIEPHVRGRRIEAVLVRQPRLRYPVPDLREPLEGQVIDAVKRRGKYLLLAAGKGHLLVHLGMSGSLRLVPSGTGPGKHDHLDWVLDSGRVLRFTDPRRFGVVDWVEGDPMAHRLLCRLGPEPLGGEFTHGYLHARSRGKRISVKSFIMDSQVVVGVGNIYANEALYLAGIRPSRNAGRISRERYDLLTDAIKDVLAAAVRQGGTTLRDFVGGDGQPGYFRQSLHVYGRAGQQCNRCQVELREVRLAQRSTVFCPACQR